VHPVMAAEYGATYGNCQETIPDEFGVLRVIEAQSIIQNLL